MGLLLTFGSIFLKKVANSVVSDIFFEKEVPNILKEGLGIGSIFLKKVVVSEYSIGSIFFEKNSPKGHMSKGLILTTINFNFFNKFQLFSLFFVKIWPAVVINYNYLLLYNNISICNMSFL